MFELTETVTRHDWEQVEDGPGGDGTRLSLSASTGGRRGGIVRGTLARPGAVHVRLGIEDWELTGPSELPGSWADRARLALAQLRLRVAGAPHATPDAGGRWDVTVRHRLRLAGAEDVPSGLAASWTFAPIQMFVDAATSGDGVLCLFGDGPVETHSARYGFVVGADGAVAFDRVDPQDRVPDWAQGAAAEVARLAFGLRAAADRRLTDMTSISKDWMPPRPAGDLLG